MIKKILANDGIDAQGKAILEKAGFSIVTEKVAQEDLIKAINDNHYIGLTVRSATKVRKDVIDACPGLKVIGRGGVGMDNIDVEYAQSKGVEVVNTPAASSMSVAELVFAHLFSLVRFLNESNREMPTNGILQFDNLKKKYAKGIELRGKTLGIIGFGRIGQAVGKTALGLGMKILAFDPFIPKAEITVDVDGTNGIIAPITTISLNDVLKNSDFISLHVPGGKVITSKEIALMKQGAGIINASRGGVIDEVNLLDALNSGKLSFAGLDVFENEPQPRQDLLSHPKVSLSPHIGAATEEAQQRIGIELAEKIIQVLS